MKDLTGSVYSSDRVCLGVWETNLASGMGGDDQPHPGLVRGETPDVIMK